ncbi:MAG: hypothetical protein E5V37_23535 [Mesorhizobium sp.]|uniref:hypothetical protein n=1 Tax=Mesorhizobium sp. TaxID=1871066 RepID=UPI000FEA55D9|nr:MAG: hypothetical protein EOQ46_05920 [Mesorhizobium sp.]RWF60327.1 MAG: hypothetical protein EOS66_02310 [Mesorhizobium sp.]TIX28314.1 MAG: hypothetical protein E5V37_23535 [Mesorhizobium sp.]
MSGPPETETAAPTAIGNGGNSKRLAGLGIYPTFSFSTIDFAAAIIADRHHLTPPVARVVVELAGMGGAHANRG